MSNDAPTQGGIPEGTELQQLISLFDAPAYIRRARGVEEALEHILLSARKVREEWLAMTRLRIGVLHALAGDWKVLRPWLVDDEQEYVLESLHQMLAPKLRLPPAPTRSSRALRNALYELIASVERFTKRWNDYLDKVDLTTVNALRAGYNRYYLLEKSCAMRSDVLARIGFVALAPLTRAELEQLLPPLPVPRTAL
jgi:hypothetical protein